MHDVFVSFTRTGHPELACAVRESLEKADFSVFMDVDVPAGEGISAQISEALNDSRIMLAVYSASYNERWACQWELMRAYLAGAAEGSAARRILVVNPEADDGHILPADIADLKYLRPDQLDILAESIARKLAQVPDPIGAAGLPMPPRWPAPGLPGAFGFTGRFRDLWNVHNALSRVDVPLTSAACSAPVVVISGLPGIGKTSLARAYGWLFGAAYPGDVFTVSLQGSAGVGAARDQFADAVRAFASDRGIAIAGQTSEQVIALLADELSAAGKTALWIVDDVPADIDSEALAQFVIPASSVRTILTSPSCAGGVDEVKITGLGEVDGLAVLRSGHLVNPADLAAARLVVSRLGGHPLALTVAAAYLRDHDGLVSYAGYAASLEKAGPSPDILATIARSMEILTAADHVAIALAGLLGAAAVPTTLIAAVLAAAGPGNGLGEQAAGAVIRRLCHGGFAQAEPAALRVHPLIIQASARLGPLRVPLAEIAVASARGLTSLLAEHPDNQLLIGTARVLAVRAELKDEEPARSLGRQVAAYCERTGDLAQAAAFRHRVAESGLASGADDVAAALACVANAEFERGIAHAQHALAAGLTGDLEIQAQWALAAGLDGVARFDEASDLWSRLADAPWTPGPGQRIAFDIARARAMLARGRLAEARSILNGVLTVSLSAPADADQLNAARTELARLLLWTGKEQEGRELAESVLRYYREAGTPGHAQCVAAELVWAEAAFALGLFELRPDRDKWVQAGELLDRLIKEYPQAAGPHSFHGPAVSVLHGLVLAWQGRPGECVEVMRSALPALQQRLGAGHPLTLRARYALSLAHCQLGDWGPGADVLADVWPAQRRLIGPQHPDTLRSQFQYGIALKMAHRGQDDLSAQMIDEVCAIMPQEVGRLNDLNAQARIAQVMRWTPYRFIAVMLSAGKLLERRPRGTS
jgi:tetratricopeptide (TPR) repeat protein